MNEIRLLPWQSKVFLSKAKNRVALTGRQSGKSYLLRVLIYEALISKTNTEVLALLNTHSQANEVIWRWFNDENVSFIPNAAIKHINNSSKILELHNGSRLVVSGVENAEVLRGGTKDLVLLDEFQSFSEHIWPEIVQPLLAKRNGRAVFTGTAKPYNQIMTFYDYGLTPNSLWESFLIRTEESGNIPIESIEIAKATLSKEQFDQEYNCIPNTFNENRVYPGFTENNILNENELNSILGDIRNDTLHIGLDFNVGAMSAVIAIIRNKKIYVIDEIVLSNSNSGTEQMVREIKFRYPNRKIIIYPDASGRNRNAANPNCTNHSLLTGFKLVFDYSGNPPIEDRIVLLNGKILNAKDEISFYVFKTCKNVIKTLTRRIYKGMIPDKSSGLDHCADALEYLVWHTQNVALTTVNSW